jgi:hypothetical protein
MHTAKIDVVCTLLTQKISAQWTEQLCNVDCSCMIWQQRDHRGMIRHGFGVDLKSLLTDVGLMLNNRSQ